MWDKKAADVHWRTSAAMMTDTDVYGRLSVYSSEIDGSF